MVSSEITSIVKEWQSYLELQKNYSKNTREAYLNDVKAYFAFIKDDKIDATKVKKVSNESLMQIQNTIREGIMQELIGYLAEQNDVKVKM